MRREATAIEAAARAGVPVPKLIAHGSDPAALDAPFIVMERVEGETVPRRILRDDAYAEVRPRLAERCGEILARVHAIAARRGRSGLETRRPAGAAARCSRLLRGAQPGARAGAALAGRHRPDAGTAAVVHGDFRNGNLMVGPDGIRAVLDWELVARGDPMEDLGYLCVRCWRFGGVDRPVGGFGALRRPVPRLRARRGGASTPSASAGGSSSAPSGGASSAWSRPRGTSPADVRSIELAAIGRRGRRAGVRRRCCTSTAAARLMARGVPTRGRAGRGAARLPRPTT